MLKSTTVSRATSALNERLESALGNGTLRSSNASFHLSIFSTDSLLLNFSHAAPGAGLTAGVLDRNTIFRTGSLGKLLTVYALVFATRML